MFHPHDPSFTYLSHQSNSTIPSLDVSPLFSQPGLHPTSIDPYANTSLYPAFHGVLGSQATSYQDPNVVSPNWVVKGAGPVAYQHAQAINSSNELAVVATSLSSLWSNNQSLVNNMSIGVPTQTKGFQSLRCEVCKIDCNSKDALQKHLSGKKHIRNSQTSNSSLVGQIGSTSYQSSGRASGVQSLLAKRLKLVEGGAAAESVKICTICNVVCNSQDVFQKHLTGKKHAVQAGLRPRNLGVRPNVGGIWSKVPKKPKFVQSSWCEVCKINCTSSDVYTKHILGKKHLKNLEKLAEPKKDTSTSVASTASQSTTTTTTNAMIGPMEKPDAGKGKSTALVDRGQLQTQQQDLDAKKQKIVESGVAAGVVRTCTICNVICNSHTVFIKHLSGQKHAAMVKKLGEPAAA